MNDRPTNVIDVTEADFEAEVILRSKETPVVVDFWAAWCGPCRMLGPVLERLAEEPESDFILAKVDVDANPNLAMKYQVQGIPAVKGFFGGKVVAEFVGAQPEPSVRQFLQRLVPSETDLHLSAGLELLAEQKWPEAEGAFRLVLQRNPAQQVAHLGLAKCLLHQGSGCEAEQALHGIEDARLLAGAENLLPLAQYLCAAERQENGNGQLDLPSLEAQYWRSAQLIGLQNMPAALDGLIGIIRADKQFRDGQAKEVMLAIFALLGSENELTRRYRSELAMVLF